MKRKREGSEVKEREKKKRKFFHSEKVKFEISENKNAHLSFFTSEPPIPKDSKFKIFTQKHDDGKTSKILLGTSGELEYTGKNELPNIPSSYALGVYSHKKNKVVLHPVSSYFFTEREYKSENISAFIKKKKELSGPNKEKIIKITQVDHNKSAPKKITKYLSEQHKKYKKRRKETEGVRKIEKKTGSLYNRDLKINRDYLPPYNEDATDNSDVFPLLQLIHSQELSLLDYSIEMEKKKEKKINEGPNNLSEGEVEGEGEGEGPNDIEDDLGFDENDDEDEGGYGRENFPKVFQLFVDKEVDLDRNEKKALNYYKYLVWFLDIQKKYRRRTFSFNVVTNEGSYNAAYSMQRNGELWNEMSKKFMTNQRRGKFVITEKDKRKIICHAIAILLNINNFSIPYSVMKKLVVDMHSTQDELNDIAVSMGIKIERKKRKKDVGYKTSYGLSVPWKLPNYRALQRIGKKKKIKKKKKTKRKRKIED